MLETVFVQYIRLRGRRGWQIESELRCKNQASSRWRKKWNLTVTHVCFDSSLCGFRFFFLFFVEKSSSNKFCTSIFMKKKCEHDCRRQGADSNDGKLSFHAHERVLRGKRLCMTGLLECESQRGEHTQRNIHSHKCRLCPSKFLQGVRLLCCMHPLTFHTAVKMRLHCRSPQKLVIAKQFHSTMYVFVSCHRRRKTKNQYVLCVADRAAN